MSKHDFHNRIRSLFNIDGHLLPELTQEQQREFVSDPVRYFIRTDKIQSDAIWREIEKRQTPMTASPPEYAAEPFTLRFDQSGDFEAVRAAETWCSARGISVGRTQAHSPRGLLYGNYDIQKWRNLRLEDRAQLHGTMIGGRQGPVTITMMWPPELVAAPPERTP